MVLQIAHACLALALVLPAYSQQFNLKDKFVGKDFLAGFRWETFDDPTHGRVNYVDQTTALQKNLTSGEAFASLGYDEG